MKQHVRLILSVICLLALLTVSALAQEREPTEAEKKAAAHHQAAKDAELLKAKLHHEDIKMMMPKFGFEMKVVKGAPYSAIAENETIQTLGDGNRIINKNKTAVYRDGGGRTRREGLSDKPGVAGPIFISDPAAGVSYFLQPRTRGAVKHEVKVKEKEIEALKARLAQELEQKDKLVQQAEKKARTQEGGQVVHSEGMPMKKRRAPVTESLGKQMIEGVECEGTRTTFTIPAGEIGNEQPLTTVSEQWYSPELQVLVLTRHQDPRNGVTTYRLTNINRAEPDRSLFEVPGDYTIQDGAKEKVLMKMKTAKPEEER